MALVSCSFEGELSDCLEDEGFSLLLEVISDMARLFVIKSKIQVENKF